MASGLHHYLPIGFSEPIWSIERFVWRGLSLRSQGFRDASREPLIPPIYRCEVGFKLGGSGLRQIT